MNASADARDEAITSLEAAVSELFRSVKHWNRELAHSFEPPLSLLGFAVLRHLRLHGPVRVGDLAAALDTDKAVVSRQLATLRDRGYVQQSEDPVDRRAAIIAISPDALAAFERSRAEVRTTYGHAVDDWSTDELAAFAAMLDRFTRGLPS